MPSSGGAQTAGSALEIPFPQRSGPCCIWKRVNKHPLHLVARGGTATGKSGKSSVISVEEMFGVLPAVHYLEFQRLLGKISALHLGNPLGTRYREHSLATCSLAIVTTRADDEGP